MSGINRQKFMAELYNLLSFMSARDREAAIAKYNDMFDAADSESELIASLGSPTRAAIALSRDYVPSDEPEAEPTPDETPEEPAAPETPEEPAAPETPEGPASPETPETPPVDGGEPVFNDITPPAGTCAVKEPDGAGEAAAAEPPKKTARPRGALKPAALILYIILSVVIGLPVAVILICVGIPFLAAGVGVVFAAVYALSHYLGSLSMVSDILLIVGACVAASGVGVFLSWLGLWLSIELGSVWIGGAVFRLGRSFCYKKEAAEK